MSGSRRSIAIQQGIYLGDADSVHSVEVSSPLNAYSRPLPPIPEPRVQSNLRRPADIRAERRGPRPPPKDLPWAGHRGGTNLHYGDAARAARRLRNDRANEKGWRLSFTPSMLQLSARAVSIDQAIELARIADTDPEKPLKELSDSAEPPDGGWLAWSHAAAGHLVAFNAQGLNMSYGVFQAYYQNVLLPSSSPAQIAWIGSFQIFLIFFMSIVVSPLMDKGHFRLCFNGGSIGLVLSVLATSFCTAWWQLFLVQGILTGISMGLIFGSGVVVLLTYFSKHMGLATGIAAAGSSTGGIVFPLLADRLLFRVGFAWTVRAMALVVLLTLIPANIVARERPGRPKKGPTSMDWSAFRDVPYLLMMAGMFFSFWGVYFGFYYIATYAQAILQLPPSSSLTLLILMNASNLPGRFLPNLLSDSCIGPLNTIIPSTFLASMQIFVWIGSSTRASLYVVACLYGFSAAGLQSLYNATIFSFAPDKSKVGVRMAMVFVVIGVACLTGAPVGGALIGKDAGGYLYAQLFAGCSLFSGAGLLLAARWAKAGWTPDRV